MEEPEQRRPAGSRAAPWVIGAFAVLATFGLVVLLAPSDPPQEPVRAGPIAPVPVARPDVLPGPPPVDDVRAQPVPEERPEALAVRQYLAGLRHMEQGELPAAIERFEAALGLDPGLRDAAARLDECRGRLARKDGPADGGVHRSPAPGPAPEDTVVFTKADALDEWEVVGDRIESLGAQVDPALKARWVEIGESLRKAEDRPKTWQSFIDELTSLQLELVMRSRR